MPDGLNLAEPARRRCRSAPADDTALIQAWEELSAGNAALEQKFTMQPESEWRTTEAWAEKHWWPRQAALEAIIRRIEPVTLAGCVVRLRLLAAPEGMEAGEQEDDIPCLRRTLAVLERLAKEKADA